MKIQILIATTNQKADDFALLKKMNIHSSAIICNQSNFNKIENVEFEGNQIKVLSFCERGVGLNRNNALMRAEADIVAFADDDMFYFDNYNSIIEKAYEELPTADVIIFNLKDHSGKRKCIKSIKKVNYFNYLRYGTARITCKLKPIRQNAIYFNQCFGGGTEHCHGEDNLFLSECLKKHLKIYTYPAELAELLDDRPSTWDEGYTEKYFRDQGILYHQISKKWWLLLCLQDSIRHQKLYNTLWIKSFKQMIK